MNESIFIDELNKKIDFDSTLSEIKDSLSDFKKQSGNSIEDIKLRNAELKKLLESYQKKNSLMKISSDYDSLEESISNKESSINSKEDYISDLSKDISKRESYVNAQMECLEQKKLILDSKERIISKAIKSEFDPEILKILELVENKFNSLKSERLHLSQEKNMIDIEWKRIKEKEEQIVNMQRSSLSKKRGVENEIIILDSEANEKKIILNSLKSKESDLSAMIKERVDLINNLDRQYREQKQELFILGEKIESQRSLFAKTQQDIEESKIMLENERLHFSQQKKEFYSKINDLSQKSKDDLSAHKKKVLEELEGQHDLVEKKMRELGAKEKMLEKIQNDLEQKESRISFDLDSISKKSQEIENLKTEMEDKFIKLAEKEKDLARYEKEITEFEKTVFDLKTALDSKKEELDRKSESINQYKIFFNKLKESSIFEKKYNLIKKNIEENMSMGKIIEAKSEFSKFLHLIRSLPDDLKEEYRDEVSKLHRKIELELQKKVMKK